MIDSNQSILMFVHVFCAFFLLFVFTFIDFIDYVDSDVYIAKKAALPLCDRYAFARSFCVAAHGFHGHVVRQLGGHPRGRLRGAEPSPNGHLVTVNPKKHAVKSI